MATPILELRDITCEVSSGQTLFQDVSFSVNEGALKEMMIPCRLIINSLSPGDTIILQGKSGSGKTTMLKCIAHLVLHKGNVLYRGR